MVDIEGDGMIEALMAFAIQAAPATPSWRIVAVSRESVDALDTASVRRDRGGASYSVAHVYPDASYGSKFSIIRYWSDCRGRNATMLTIQSHNLALQPNPPTGANNLPITDPIEPASAMSKLERAACDVNARFQMPAINDTAAMVRTADTMF
jgi:hypothetical protein